MTGVQTVKTFTFDNGGQLIMQFRFEEDETIPIPAAEAPRSGSFGRLGIFGGRKHKHGKSSSSLAAAGPGETSGITEDAAEWDDSQDFQETS